MFTKAICLLAVLVLAGCQGSKQEGQAIAADETTIKVETVRCDMCVTNISNALEKIDGVEGVEVSLKEHKATVKYVASKVTRDALVNAIAQAGYNADSTPRNEEAYRDLPKCCR